ncbi:MAG: 1-acyl-sn-glycerol-3-phosphate acyltransferase [Treponema sp.]|jgi:1-acyl-sn-glycerol-3-phosphate acyltransferase|nr:1-acyl-sn-glycerol-3-phosphate acyltransferase [Treponema sp.]
MPYKRGRPLADLSLPFEFASALTFYLLWPIAELINFIFFSGTYENRWKLKPFKKAILVANHTNAFDPVHLSGMVLPYRTWHTLLEATVLTPFLGTFIRLLGGVPIPLGLSGLNRLLRFAEIGLTYRRFILFYPEGECYLYNQEIQDFKPGAFYISASLDLPVIPLVTIFSEGPHKRRTFLGRPFPKQKTIALDAVYPSDYVRKDDKGDFTPASIREFGEAVRQKMQQEIYQRSGTMAYYKGHMERMKGINDRR